MNLFKKALSQPTPSMPSFSRKKAFALWLVIAKSIACGHPAPLKRIFVAFAVPPAI